MPDQTQPLPPQRPDQPAQGSDQSAQGSDQSAQPTQPTPPPASPPGGPTAYGSSPEGRRPGLWRQATATTGARIATGVALALTGLLLLGVLGAGVLTAARVGDRLGDRFGDRGGPVAGPWEDRRGPGDQLPGPREQGKHGRGEGQGPGKGRGQGDGGLGAPGMLQRFGVLQYGEITVTDREGETAALLVQRGEVTAASATSLSVRSEGGFSQTYVLNGDTETRGRATSELEEGEEVYVVATKEDRAALLVHPGGRR